MTAFKFVLGVLVFSFGLSTGAAAQPIEIAVLGDSLSAGYGLGPGESFPEQLQESLREKGYGEVTILGAGVSGDTSAGGLARLDWSVPDDAEGVIVELGANDALRGLDPESTRRNIDAIVDRSQERGQRVLLAGMLAPPNLGPQYGEAFASIFPDVATARGTLLYPFFLDGVAADPSLNQADGLHPTAEGVGVIVERILPQVEALIERIRVTPRTN